MLGFFDMVGDIDGLPGVTVGLALVGPGVGELLGISVGEFVGPKVGAFVACGVG